MVPFPKRLGLTTVGAALALAAAPAAGDAATTFGSPLAHAPNSGHCTVTAVPCTHVSFSHPGSNGDQVEARAPVSGVITKFRLRATRTGPGPATVRFRLANIAQAGNEGAAATAVGPAGPTVTVAGNGSVEEFPARLPVGTGSHLALDTAAVNAIYTAPGGGVGYLFAAPLTRGPGLRASTAATGELLLQATVEPDADHDGFGDQSQDRTKPRLTNVALRRGQAAFRLSERAQVAVRLTRQNPGGRTRTVKSMRVRARRGANSVNLKARLRPGRYRLALAATDTAGNRSNAVVKRLRLR